jgi:hypothetical protein
MKLHYVLPLLVLVAGCQQAGPDNSFQMEVERKVRNELRDPESAQFKDHYLYPANDVACGSVNSKNGFGGYIGFHYYAYADGRVYFADGDTAGFSRVSKKCSELKAAELHADIVKGREERAARKANSEKPLF